MVINTKEIINALQIIADEEHVRVTVKSCATGAVVTAASTFLGGLLLGPRGLLLGGTLGGLAACAMGDDFRPLSEVIITDLSDKQKEELAQHVANVVNDFNYTDLIEISVLILRNDNLKDAALQCTLKFVEKVLGMQQQKIL